MHAAFWVGITVLEREECVFFATANWRWLPDAGCPHSCRRDSAPVSLHWGAERSVGRHLGLCRAILGLTPFLIGYLIHAFAKRRG